MAHTETRPQTTQDLHRVLCTRDEKITMTDGPLSAEELRKIDAYWRAANYMSLGQIYLMHRAWP